jgi:hypothetical protein
MGADLDERKAPFIRRQVGSEVPLELRRIALMPYLSEPAVAVEGRVGGWGTVAPTAVPSHVARMQLLRRSPGAGNKRDAGNEIHRLTQAVKLSLAHWHYRI